MRGILSLLPCATALTFFAASDTHFGHDVGNATSFEKNTWAIREMNALPRNGTWPASLGGGPVGEPFGVTVSGDLLDGGVNPSSDPDGCAQWANFTALYGFDGTDGLLRYPVYEGRGNHDGGNSTLPDPRGCVGHVSTNIIARNKRRAADARFAVDGVSSPTGLHYSWTVNVSAACRLHFVHLNLFPGFTCGSASNPTGEGPAGGSITCKGGDIAWPENSLGFLQDDLAKHASGPGVMAITLQHYGFDGFSNGWYNEGACITPTAFIAAALTPQHPTPRAPTTIRPAHGHVRDVSPLQLRSGPRRPHALRGDVFLQRHEAGAVGVQRDGLCRRRQRARDAEGGRPAQRAAERVHGDRGRARRGLGVGGHAARRAARRERVGEGAREQALRVLSGGAKGGGAGRAGSP